MRTECIIKTSRPSSRRYLPSPCFPSRKRFPSSKRSVAAPSVFHRHVPMIRSKHTQNIHRGWNELKLKSRPSICRRTQLNSLILQAFSSHLLRAAPSRRSNDAPRASSLFHRFWAPRRLPGQAPVRQQRGGGGGGEIGNSPFLRSVPRFRLFRITHTAFRFRPLCAVRGSSIAQSAIVICLFSITLASH